MKLRNLQQLHVLACFRGSNKIIVPGIRPEPAKKSAPKKVKLNEYSMTKVKFLITLWSRNMILPNQNN